MREFTKEEVLSREELEMDNSIDAKHFKQQGSHPDNQTWHGEKCYVPVLYKSQPFKMRVRIKPRG